MQKETVTFDKLPEAVGYLTEQVIELKRMVSELQPPASDKHQKSQAYHIYIGTQRDTSGLQEGQETLFL